MGGTTTSHGHCGYHLNMLSNEDMPWCRTMHKCGYYSIRGSWDYCDSRGVERHWDRSGNRYYDAKEFSKFYGSQGGQKWSETKSTIERRQAHNGQSYGVHEFRDYYIDGEGERGWVEKWVKAEDTGTSSQSSWEQRSSSQSSWEKRKANDGSWYTWQEFEQYYGSRATERWNAAKHEL